MDEENRESASKSRIVDLIKQAQEFLNNKQYTEAEFYFKKIVKRKPDFFEGWYGRGLCLKYLEQFTKASYCLGKALELDESNPKVWYNRGFVLWRINEDEEALYHINKCLKLQPDYPLAWAIKGKIYLEFSDMKNAKRIYDHLTSTNPNFIDELNEKLEDGKPMDLKLSLEFINYFETSGN